MATSIPTNQPQTPAAAAAAAAAAAKAAAKGKETVTRNPFSGTKQIVSDGIKTLVDNLSGTLKGLAGDVSGKFQEILSDELQYGLDIAKTGWARMTGFISPITKPFTQLLKHWMLQVPMFKRMTGWIGDLAGIEKLRRKEELAQKGIKAKGWLAELLDLLFLPLALILGMIGAVVRKILLPFEIVFKLWKAFLLTPGKWAWAKIALFKKMFESVWHAIIGQKNIGQLSLAIEWYYRKFMKTIRHNKVINFIFIVIEKIFKAIGWVGKKIGGIFKFIMKAGAQIVKAFNWLSKIPGLGILFRALKVGFKFLGWPLQILLSAIDFIKGFVNTKGNFLEKLKGGLTNMITKFLEFPVRLLAGVYDWIMEQLGFRKKGDPGSGDKAMNILTDLVSRAIGGLGNLVQSFIELVKNAIVWLQEAWMSTKVWWYNLLTEFPTIGKMMYGGEEGYRSRLAAFDDDVRQRSAELKQQNEEDKKKQNDEIQKKAAATTTTNWGGGFGENPLESKKTNTIINNSNVTNNTSTAPTSIPSSRYTSQNPRDMGFAATHP
jgi:hypothetical protein